MLSTLSAVLSLSSCPTDVPSVELANDVQEINEIQVTYLASLGAEIEAISFDGEAPSNAWEYFQSLSNSSEDQRLSCLFRLVAQDMYVRLTIMDVNFAAASNPNAQHQIPVASRMMAAVDRRNQHWLQAEVTNGEWFSISEAGEEADHAAFLIVQHADQNVPFQQAVLERLSILVEQGETSVSNFAYLSDRVAVNTGQAQLYGTQGWCTGMGTWEPREFEGSLDDLDQRRVDVGLEPLETYIDQVSLHCTNDQRY